MSELIPVPSAGTITGLIKEFVAFMAGQSAHTIADTTELATLGIEGPAVFGVVGAVQLCFGVQVSPAVLQTEIRTIGQLAQALGDFVHSALSARATEPTEATPGRLLLMGGAGTPELEQAVARRGWRAAMFTHYDPAQGAGPRVGTMGVVDHIEAADWSQPLGVVQRIVDLYVGGHIQRVVPADEFGLLPACLATTQLGITGLSLEAVRNTRDKMHMRHVLEEAGLGQLQYAICRSLEEAQAFLDKVGGPIILKPVSGTGSDGVSRVKSADELAAAFRLAAGAAGFTGILCEEYIEGPEVSLEGYSVDGRFVPVALTDKLIDENFLEIGHQQPSSLPQSVFDAAADIAGRALFALGVYNGVTHTEFRISSRGPVLIETHTRMGGDHIHLLTRLTTGVDLADLMVAFSLGEKVDIQPTPQGRAAAVRFSVGRPGRVRGVSVPAIEPGSGIQEVLGPPLGKVVTGRSSSPDRLARVIATGPTPQAAGKTAEDFLTQIQVDYFEQAVAEPAAVPAAV